MVRTACPGLGDEVKEGIDVVERLDTRVDFTRPDDDERDSFDLWDSGGELDQKDSDEVEAILAQTARAARQ